MAKITDIEIPDDLKGLPPMEAFCSVWKLLRFVLDFVKIFTGSKADAKIDQVLEWGDGVCAAQALLGDDSEGKESTSA